MVYVLKLKIIYLSKSISFKNYPPIAINISFTFIDVLADVSMKSKLLSSA